MERMGSRTNRQCDRALHPQSNRNDLNNQHGSWPLANEEMASALGYAGYATKVRKTPCRPRSWANSSLLQLYSHRNAWGQLASFGPT